MKSEGWQAMSISVGLLSAKPCTEGGGRWHKNCKLITGLAKAYLGGFSTVLNWILPMQVHGRQV